MQAGVRASLAGGGWYGWNGGERGDTPFHQQTGRGYIHTHSHTHTHTISLHRWIHCGALRWVYRWLQWRHWSRGGMGRFPGVVHFWFILRDHQQQFSCLCLYCDNSRRPSSLSRTLLLFLLESSCPCPHSLVDAFTPSPPPSIPPSHVLLLPTTAIPPLCGRGLCGGTSAEPMTSEADLPCHPATCRPTLPWDRPSARAGAREAPG